MLEDRIRSWLEKPPSAEGTNAVSDGETLIAMTTDIGLKRNENQDRAAAIWVDAGGVRQHSFLCVVVSDGMGGMKEGAASANTAVSSFLATLVYERQLPANVRLRSAAEMANQAVHDRISGGGTTLSAVLIEDEIAHLVNVGDSRIYTAIGNGQKARLERATIDDSMKEAFGAEGEGLLQFIGMGEGLEPHIMVATTNFDSLLITTDGAHSIGDEVLSRVYLNAESLSEAVQRITALARWTGGQDNATVAAVAGVALRRLASVLKDAEIAIWNPFGQLQIAWITPPARQGRVNEQHTGKSDDLDSIKKIGGKNRRNRNQRRKKPAQDQKEKVQLDIGFSLDGSINKNADS